jgi:hypothetical protein
MAGNRNQPSAYGSEVMELDGLRYVVLRNVCGPMAVYRVRNDGRLKSLRRWPAGIDGDESRP